MAPTNGRFHFRIEPLEVEILREADADGAKRAALVGNEIDHGTARRSIVAVVAAGDGVQEQTGIADTARERAHMVQGIPQRHRAVATDSPVGGFEPHRAAERGGDTDGSPGIAPHGPKDDIRGDGGARSAA